MKQAKSEALPLCPLAEFAECRRERCALWDDDWAHCSLGGDSRFNDIRTAVCDAMVDVMDAYKISGKAGTDDD